VSFIPQSSGEAGLSFFMLTSPDLKETTLISLIAEANGEAKVVIDRSNSSLSTTANKGLVEAPLNPGPTRKSYSMRIIVDHSVVEVFLFFLNFFYSSSSAQKKKKNK